MKCNVCNGKGGWDDTGVPCGDCKGTGEVPDPEKAQEDQEQRDFRGEWVDDLNGETDMYDADGPTNAFVFRCLDEIDRLRALLEEKDFQSPGEHLVTLKEYEALRAKIKELEEKIIYDKLEQMER